MAFEIDTSDIKNIRKAIDENPKRVLTETKKFLQRGVAAYLRTINGTPWRMGMSGGGAPVKTGQLKESHLPPIYGDFEARIRANNTGQAKYAPYVHGIDGFPRKRTYQLRPWLDYAKRTNEDEIDRLSYELVGNIIIGLQ